MASGRKRSRKSKLEVRKDCEFEDEILQEVLRSIDDETKIIDSLEDQTPPIQLSIKVEVEEYNEHYETEASEPLKQIIETIQGRRCYIVLRNSYDDILETSRNIAENSTNMADKIIDIAVKNTVGNFRRENIELDAHELMLNICLDLEYRSIWKKKVIFPLFYQCYLCGLAWWHLYPFKEHIRIHDPTQFTVQCRINNADVYIIAAAAQVKNVSHIDVEGICSRCGQGSNFHTTPQYRCLSCKLAFISCEEMTDHMYLNCEARIDTQRVQCRICDYFVDKQLLEEHLCLKHTVRSDVPMPVYMCSCKRCGGKFYHHNTHRCPQYRNSCNMCDQKLSSPITASLHASHNTSIIACRICDTKMLKCREVAHMLTHTKNYMLAYKCSLCTDGNVFIKNNMATWHIKCHHTGRVKHKKPYAIPFPQGCIRESSVIIVKNWFEETPLEEMLKKDVNNRNALEFLMEIRLQKFKHNISNEIIHISDNEDDAGTNNEVNNADTQNIIDESDSDVDEDDNDVYKDDKDDNDVDEDDKDNNDVYKDDNDVDEDDKDDNGVNEDDYDEDKDNNDVYKDDNDGDKDDNDAYKDDNDAYKDDNDVDEDDNDVDQDDREVDKYDNEIDKYNNEIDTDDNDVKKYDKEVNKDKIHVNKYDVKNSNEVIFKFDENIKIKEEPIDADEDTNYEDLLSKVFIYKNKKEIKIKSEPMDVEHDIDVNECDINAKYNENSLNNRNAVNDNDINNKYNIDTRNADNDEYSDNYQKTNSNLQKKDTDIHGNDSESHKNDSESHKNDIENESVLNILEIDIKDEPLDYLEYSENIEVTPELSDDLAFFSEDKRDIKEELALRRKRKERRGRKRKYPMTPKKEVVFACCECKIKYSSFSTYYFHKVSHHGFRDDACPICGEFLHYYVEYKFLNHINRHVKDTFVSYMKASVGKSKKMIRCRQCGEATTNDNSFVHWDKHLNTRQKTKEEIPDFPEFAPENPDFSPEIPDQIPEMQISGKLSEKILKPAILQNTLAQLLSSQKTRRCLICLKNFDRANDCKRHLIEHLLLDAHVKKMELKCLKCQICPKVFPNDNRYKFHMREHGGMPIHQCGLCLKTFSDSSNFAKHKKVHIASEDHIYICDICKAKFHTKITLESHLEKHEDPIECEPCGRTFYRKSEFRKHMTNKHLERKYTCRICSETFSSLKDKWVHDWGVHKERKQKIDCGICNMAFRKKHELMKHVKDEHSNVVMVYRGRKSKILWNK